MRLLALTGVVVIALVGAGQAEAHHLPSAPVISGSPASVTADVWAELLDRAVRPTTADPVAVPQRKVDTIIEKMRRLGRINPAVKTIGVIGLAASAIPIAYKLSVSANDYYYDLSTDQGGYHASITTEDPGWLYCATDTACGHNTLHSTFPTLPTSDYWVLAPDKDTATGAIYYDVGSGFGTAWWNSMAPVIVDNAANAAITENAQAHASNPRLTTMPGDEPEGWEMGRITSTDFDNTPARLRITKTYTVPGDLGTTADKEAAATALGSAGSQTVEQQQAEEALCVEAGLEGCAAVFALPQPTINETYTAYITRLEALGYVGTATTTVLTNALEGYGPSAPVRIIVTEAGATTTTTLDPLLWPGTAVHVEADSDITIRYNPSTAPEAPGETGTTPTPGTTTVTGTPTTIPSAPAVDFSPVTDIDFGCKFPYGIFCYAIDFTEQFDVAPDAPVFTFDMEIDVALGAFDLGTYTVDQNVMDSWMVLWRDILSVVMVVGAIYFVATRMLGFKAGGDPGAAMDDVF